MADYRGKRIIPGILPASGTRTYAIDRFSGARDMAVTFHIALQWHSAGLHQAHESTLIVDSNIGVGSRAREA